MEDDKKEIELSEKMAMIYLPENAVEVECNCTVYNNGELVKVTKTLKMSDIQAAFLDAEENYIDDNTRFVVTDKGLQAL